MGRQLSWLFSTIAGPPCGAINSYRYLATPPPVVEISGEPGRQGLHSPLIIVIRVSSIPISGKVLNEQLTSPFCRPQKMGLTAWRDFIWSRQVGVAYRNGEGGHLSAGFV